MPKTERRIHLLVSSTPDSLAYGLTKAKQELDIIYNLPAWELAVDQPKILFRLDTKTVMTESLVLCDAYRSKFGNDVSFGVWSDIQPARCLQSYVTLAENLSIFCDYTEITDPTFLLQTDRPEAFHALDVSVPVGLGALSQSVPQGTLMYLYCPQTPRYTLMASLLHVPCLDTQGLFQIVIGEEALKPRPAPNAHVVFLAPWLEEK